MEITQSNLLALFTGFDMRYQEVFNSTPVLADKIAMTVPCTTETLLMPWLQVFPKVREWEGDRVFNNYISKNLQITPKLWELTESIAATAIADDQVGLFMGLAPARMASAFRKFPDTRIAKAIQDNADTFDGEAFFSENHPVNPGDASLGVQSNLLLNLDDGYAPGGLTPDNLAAARALLDSMKGPDGLPLGLGMGSKKKLMVPPNMRQAAMVAASAGFYPASVANGAAPVSNVNLGEYEVIVNPFLLDDTSWFLLNEEAGAQPFIWCERQAPQYTTITDPQNPLVFLRNEYVIGGQCRGEAALGLYYLAVRGTSSAS